MRGMRTFAVAAVAVGGLLVAGAAPASAHGSSGFGHQGFTAHTMRSGWHPGHGHVHGPKVPTLGDPVPVAQHLAGPLTFEVGGGGAVTVGQSFAGVVTLVRPGAAPQTLATTSGPDVEVAGVSTGPSGRLTYTERAGGPGAASSSLLYRTAADGSVTLVDLLAYEQANNPDAVTTYAFADVDPACAASLPEGFAPYGGAIDSHAYGTLSLPNGTTYVADAGANAVLRVDKRGHVSTVAVLPPAVFTATPEAAAAFGLPDCVVGHDFGLEPVPTDVELGPDGWLYVTSLPGGPEDGSLGALGSVYRVNPGTGQVKLLATGLSGATGLAVAPNGTVFVAELYANEVSAIGRDGTVTTVATPNQPAGVELAGRTLYVSTDVFGDGQVVAMRLR